MSYLVTYKNVLRPHKNKSDYLQWLQHYWTVQRRWGATSYDLWSTEENNRRILFCRYTVSDLDKWTASAANPSCDRLVEDLSQIVDVNRMSIKITNNN